MFDSEYFRTALQADVDAVGGAAIVAVHLLGGRTHHVRSVLAVHSGYATVEAYQGGGDELAREPRWKEELRPGSRTHETQRAVLPYESIVDVTITPVRADGAGAIGFGVR